MDRHHWLLWDGDCGFCERSVRMLPLNRAQEPIVAVAYQEAPSPPMTPELAEACRHAVQFVFIDGRIKSGADALLEVLARTSWGWFARLLGIPPFVWVLRLGYPLVANNRQFFSRVIFRAESACSIRRPVDKKP